MSLPEHDTNGICAAPHVSLHELEGGGVLFDAQGKRLYAFNETATFIWRRIEDGISEPLIIEQVSRDFAIARETATDFVASAIRCWAELSLLSTPSRRPHYAGAPNEARVSPRVPSNPPAKVACHTRRSSEEKTQAASAACYRLFDMPFIVRGTDPKITGLIEDFLWPLASQRANRPLTAIDVVTTDDGIAVSVNGTLRERCAAAPDLLPLIKTCLIELALGRSKGIGAVHAAAVAGPHGAVLLPAPSGEGKSTLTAALMEAGFRLLGDDTIALTEAVEARPAPFAICLKEGAWSLLSSRFPQLARAETYRRLDGKMVRYLFPSGQQQVEKPDSRHAIRWVVFLRRGTDEAVRLVPLTRADALARLTAEFSPLSDGLSEPQIARLVQWIKAVDCFELRFTDLDEGVQQIARLCGAPHVAEFADRH